MEFRTTREIVQDIRGMEHGSELKVVLIDVGAQAMQYMHDEKFATARKLFSLNDVCQNSFDYDMLYEAANAHMSSSTPKEVVEDAFVEALEFADSVQNSAGSKIQQHLQNANAYYVGGISCRGQLVVGLFK